MTCDPNPNIGGCITGPEGDATIAFLQNPLGFLERNTVTYGGVVGLQLGGELVALVTDPAVAKFVMIDSASLFVKVTHTTPRTQHPTGLVS